MMAVIVLFGVELLTILFLGFEKVSGPQDVWIYIMGIAAIIGTYVSLKLDNQKIKIEQAALKLQHEENLKRIAKMETDLKNKVDSGFCVNAEREHKKEMTGLAVMISDLSKELKNDMAKVNQKIDDNHNEVLNTILSIVTKNVIQ